MPRALTCMLALGGRCRRRSQNGWMRARRSGLQRCCHLDFSALHAGLDDGSLADLDAITERVLVLSRAAANRLAEQQGTGRAQYICMSGVGGI